MSKEFIGRIENDMLGWYAIQHDKIINNRALNEVLGEITPRRPRGYGFGVRFAVGYIQEHGTSDTENTVSLIRNPSKLSKRYDLLKTITPTEVHSLPKSDYDPENRYASHIKAKSELIAHSGQVGHGFIGNVNAAAGVNPLSYPFRDGACDYYLLMGPEDLLTAAVKLQDEGKWIK